MAGQSGPAGSLSFLGLSLSWQAYLPVFAADILAVPNLSAQLVPAS